MIFSNAVSSSQMPLTPITPSSGCRFIPSRQRQSTPWHEHCARKLFDGIREKRDRTDKPPNFQDDHVSANRRLLAAIFETDVTPRLTKILQFRTPISTHENVPASLWNDFNRNRELPDNIASPRRHISSTPERVLDSPDLVDDYYLNLLHWSAQNVIAVALSDCVYTWHAATATTTLLTSTSNLRDSVTSLRWSDDGATLAIGTNSSALQIWDVTSRRNIRTIQGHEGRISVSAWKQRSRHVITTGSRDNTIKQHDIRQANATTVTLGGHSQEVCGLQWSPDGTQLASGSNDNLAKIWDANAMQSGRPPRLTLDKHVAAVKALAWCPWQSRLLATGGGTADRCIRFWNSSDGVCLGGVDTQSQVCGLVWSEHDRELLSAHGFSKNQLTIWSYPHMTRVADLVGHSARVLHLTLSPDATTVCSASADETLRLWKVFRPAPERKRAVTSQERSKTRGLLRTLEFR